MSDDTAHISRKFIGRVTWLEEEMGFVYCVDHHVWEFEADHEVAAVDRQTINQKVSMATFQRAVVEIVKRAKIKGA